ncbi:hypothetical protein [Streptomyces sp. ST2-7A]|uniref:hypothetical protein n=1 Tax=Streptomyces sp. ST2-7A TaxID=2907214 RepID=UPI001F1843B4|nr:hypothetical protein [Streptomyces sp. ST2-7A]MCE7078900.1 hypothetical protein [Streptomyces sp. ST2-7A]
MWPEGPEDPEAEGAEGADGAVHPEDGYDWDDGFTPEPPADGVVCCNCERRTTAPTPVRYVQTVSGPGFVLHACPQCVLTVPHGPLPDDVL